MWQKLVEWWHSLWREEYILTIYFPGETTTLADGSTVEKPASQKEFVAKKLLKKGPKQFKWIDTDDREHELTFLKPVVFHVIKVY